MRIVYILTTLGIGGAEKQVIEIAERMALRGHFVSLLVLKHAEEEWLVKLPVLRLNLRKTPASVWQGLRFAQNFLVLARPDILHSHTFPANIFARLLRILLGRGLSAPVIFNTIHNIHEGGWHRMLLYRATDRSANAVTAVSSAAADRFVSAGAVARRKMTVLTNGINSDAFRVDSGARKRMRTQMHAGDSFIWLAVGRIVQAKDYPNLLRAFLHVRETQPNSRLWIAGDGDPGNIPELAQLLQQHSGSIEMLGLRRDIQELLNGADGFVLSSAWEGMPLAVGEAMATAKPVVATDVGGVRELIANTGITVPPKDSDSLARAMLEIMATNEKVRLAMGRAARERIVASFSISTRADQWEALYAEWVQRRSA